MFLVAIFYRVGYVYMMGCLFGLCGVSADLCFCCVENGYFMVVEWLAVLHYYNLILSKSKKFLIYDCDKAIR